MSNIAVVIPTIRMKESMPAFMKAWQLLFDKHNVVLIVIEDGENPKLTCSYEVAAEVDTQKIETTRAELDTEGLVSNYCAGVRQLGFLYIAKHLPEVKYIITLDDDEFPIGDTIQDHIDQLNRKVPISWLSTGSDYFRGFPYGVRTEAPVMLSHGIWRGVPDYDAPTQLLIDPNHKPTYYKGVIPKGIYFPMCGMNLAFRREAIPHIFFAPVGGFKGAERFDDILAGILVVKKFAELNWGIVSGYAEVDHQRASNVFTSLEKEAVGIRHNEEFWKDPENYNGDVWFDEFRLKAKAWYNLTK